MPRFVILSSSNVIGSVLLQTIVAAVLLPLICFPIALPVGVVGHFGGLPALGVAVLHWCIQVVCSWFVGRHAGKAWPESAGRVWVIPAVFWALACGLTVVSFGFREGVLAMFTDQWRFTYLPVLVTLPAISACAYSVGAMSRRT